MNFQEPYRIHQIDFDNIVYNKVKTSESKKIIFIKYQEKHKQNPFVIQCPTILSVNEAYKINDDYHELEIPLITQEKNKNELLINFFEDLDRKIISDAKNNSKLWFDEVKNKDSIRYKKIIKESDTYKDGIIRLKIIKNVDFETLLQIENKKRLQIKDIPNNSWCKMLLEIYAIVINYQNNSFYVFLRPIILSFKEKQIVNYNYKFLEDSDSDKGELDIPDSELNGLFLKSTCKIKNDNLTSSQIKMVDNMNISQNKKFTESSSTSSDNLTPNKVDSNKVDSNKVDSNKVDFLNKDRLSSSSSSSTNSEDDRRKLTLTEENDIESRKYPEKAENSPEKSPENISEKLSPKINSSSTSSEKIRLTDSSSSESSE
jgi:hypothetical protein